MRFAHRFAIDLLCVAALCGVLAACTKTNGEKGQNTGTGGGTSLPGTGGVTAPGTGGSAAPGSGGSAAPGSGGMGSAGSGGGGMGSAGSGSGGMSGGGSGGMSGGGSGGMSGGGSGGMSGGGSGGMGGGDQCVTDVTTGDPMTDAKCAACLCKNCNAEVTAMKGDAKAQALLDCGRMHNCSGSCCFCGMMCDSLGGNYRMGPCAPETEMAAGQPTPSTAATDGANLSMACMMSGNSCNKPAVLADCTMKMCPMDCPAVPACM